MSNNKKDREQKKAEFQKMIERIKKRRAAFIEQKRAERKREAAAISTDTGTDLGDITVVNRDLFAGLDINAVNDIEILFNESLAACYEGLRQIALVEKQEWLEAQPAIIEQLTGDVERLRNEFTAKQKELIDLINAVRNETTTIEVRDRAPHRVIRYDRRMPKIMDARLPENTKRAYINELMNY